jgi:hypothetical protein
LSVDLFFKKKKKKKKEIFLCGSCAQFLESLVLNFCAQTLAAGRPLDGGGRLRV